MQSNKRKILFVLENFAMGGVERVTLNLIKGLNSTGQFDIHCAVECDVGTFKDEYHSIAIIQPLIGTSLFSRQHSFNLLIERLKPDYVLCTKGNLTKYPLMSNIFGYHQPKIIVVQHSPIMRPEINPVKNWIRKLGAILLYSGCDKIVCVSEGIKNEFQKKLHLKESKMVVIHNPVLNTEIMALAQEQHEYSGKEYFVAVGRVSYEKGYDLLVAVTIELRKLMGGDTPHILIVGDGPDVTNLKKLINKKGVADILRLVGQQENPYKYIAQSKGLLLSSRWEGMPTVIVEASYLQKQIVAFDCRYGPRELMQGGKTGYLIPVGYVEEFAQAIIDISKGDGKPIPDVDEYSIRNSTVKYGNLFSN